MDGQEELVRRMQSGDTEAFDRIFQCYGSRLLHMAYLISGSYADSEDIVQETFITCYLKCGELRDVSGFTSWLYRILTRTAWKHGRERKREEPVEELYEKGEPETGNQPLLHTLEAEMKNELYEAIKNLPEKHRTVIVLYYFNQLSTKEIARIVGCMEGTVKSRLYMARRKLGDILREEEMSWMSESWTL